MDLIHVKAFLAVAEELHFGRAATRLHIGAPALSRTIAQLERRVGARLFDRTTRTVRLTLAGQAFLDPAREIVAAFTAGEHAVQQVVAGVGGTVSIGFGGPSTQTMVSKLAQAVRTELPGIELSLRGSAYGSQALADIENCTLDLAIARAATTPLGIGSRVLTENLHRIAMPPGHSLADRTEVAFDELTDEDWILLAAPGSLVSEETLRRAQIAGFTPRVVQKAPDTPTVMALVAAGLGITMTTDRAVADGAAYGVRVAGIADDPHGAPSLLVWRSTDPSPTVRHVLSLSEKILPTPIEEIR